MKNIEMHCHSTLSDGKNIPNELIREAKRLDLWFLALTDHDSISSQEFQSSLKQEWIETCDSVEISAKNFDLDKSLHLVSYAKTFNQSLHDVLNNSKIWKMKMKWEQFDKLVTIHWFVWNKEAFDMFMRDLWREPETSNKYDMSRYFLTYSKNKEKVKNILWKLYESNDIVLHFYLECLKRWWALYNEYGHEVKEYEPSVKQTVIEVVEKSGGIVSMAHPNVTFNDKKWWIPEFERTIWDYVKKWVNWIEINSIASYEWVRSIIKMKQKYDCILTFWSDCHTIWKIDSKHSTIGRINPFIETELYEKWFLNFRETIGI